ncbi:hypothetical protein CEXT_596491, partial [Caerostris extrusa]
ELADFVCSNIVSAFGCDRVYENKSEEMREDGDKAHFGFSETS